VAVVCPSVSSVLESTKAFQASCDTIRSDTRRHDTTDDATTRHDTTRHDRRRHDTTRHDTTDDAAYAGIRGEEVVMGWR
jgi:hypothetical protein